MRCFDQAIREAGSLPAPLAGIPKCVTTDRLYQCGDQE
jgi:hypothetical protein